ncbi:MAG TPA: hypothetical protein VGE67_08620 [Haloferula sp.]
MTSRRVILLVASHLAVLGLAYQLSQASRAASEGDPNSPGAATKVSDRSSSSAMLAGDGQALLASFIETHGPLPESGLPLYEELKKTLPVASDPEAAALAAILAFSKRQLPDKLDPGESERLEAEASVRILHWLRASGDPGKVLDQLATYPETKKLGLLSSLSWTAFKDMASEQGILKASSWLEKIPDTRRTFMLVALEEMKQGGGLSLINQLESEIKGGPMAGWLPLFSMWNKEDKGERSYYLSVGQTASFAERQALLDMALDNENEHIRDQLLLGFSRSGKQAMDWLLEQEGLDPKFLERVKTAGNFAATKDTSLAYDQRIDALIEAHGPGDKQPDRQALMNDMVREDLNGFLSNGRDWRYEFRHGVATLDEVLAAAREGMPKMPPAVEEAFTVGLYRELVEEDPRKALPLLDSLPEDRRRDALFNSTWQSMVNIAPDDYLSFFSSLPEPETPAEKDLRTKGWNWKARGFLMRYGDDYVEWVKQMPEGIDKETAMNSLIWATREQNPAEARKLNDQLYPPKADATK